MNQVITLGHAAQLIQEKAVNYWDEIFPASVIIVSQKRRDAPIPITAISAGQSHNLRPQPLLIASYRACVTLGRSRLTYYPAHPPLLDFKLAPQVLHTMPTPQGA